MRQALYRELLAAEQLADKALGQEAMVVKEEDFDKDGMKEILLESAEQNIYVAPQAGGSIFEWDLRRPGINLLNVLTRRAEGYHRQLLHSRRSLARGQGFRWGRAVRALRRRR